MVELLTRWRIVLISVKHSPPVYKTCSTLLVSVRSERGLASAVVAAIAKASEAPRTAEAKGRSAFMVLKNEWDAIGCASCLRTVWSQSDQETVSVTKCHNPFFLLSLRRFFLFRNMHQGDDSRKPGRHQGDDSVGGAHTKYGDAHDRVGTVTVYTYI